MARELQEQRKSVDPNQQDQDLQTDDTTGASIAVLLCGGDKRTQDADIKRAIKISKDWKG